MLFLGVPIIEYLDLAGTSRDTEDALRDTSGRPVTSYRHFGLVLGANNYDELKAQAAYVVGDRGTALEALLRNYKKLFPCHDNSKKHIALEIVRIMEKGQGYDNTDT